MAGGLFGGIASGLQSGIQLGQRQQLLKDKQAEQFMKKAKANLDATKERLQEITDPANLSMLIDAGLAKGESLPQIRSSIASAIDQMAGMGNGLYEKVGGQGDYFNTDLLKQKAMTAQGTEALRQAELVAKGEDAGAVSAAQHAAGSAQLEQDVDKGLKSGASQTYFQAFNSKTGDHIQGRGTNVEIQKLEEQGYEIAPGAQQTGEANPFATPRTVANYVEQGAAAFEFISSGNEIITKVHEFPDANTAIGAMARGVGEVKAEIHAAATLFSGGNSNVQVEREDGTLESIDNAFERWTNQFDEGGYFTNLGEASAEVKGMLLGLAFKLAATQEQGGRFSDQQIDQAMKQIGGNYSQPNIIATNINRAQQQILRKYHFMAGQLGFEPSKMPEIVTLGSLSAAGVSQSDLDKREAELKKKLGL